MEAWTLVIPAALVMVYLVVRAIVRGNPFTRTLFEREFRESLDREAIEQARLDVIRKDRLRRIRLGLTTEAERASILKESAEAFVALDFARERRKGVEAARKDFAAGRLTVAEAQARYRSLVEAQGERKDAEIAQHVAAWERLSGEIFNI